MKRMGKTWFKRLSLVIAVLLLISFVVVVSLSTPKYLNLTIDQIEAKIKAGMTPETVINNVGRPHVNSGLRPDSLIIWTYYNHIRTEDNFTVPMSFDVIIKDGRVEECFKYVK